ncbi:hypothetical protein P5673_031512 [Acropora cervicornis]|uniref:Uncharacterized protein n=1 Tax=Acropora cervicornis TaxID=6130 RepID=A0AAD9PSR9_ACRCE|nr:hypothetical protein P5673_031512 [Acropora cervicornis]
MTNRNCKRDYSTCHTCDDTARIQHCAILSKSNEKPAKLKRHDKNHKNETKKTKSSIEPECPLNGQSRHHVVVCLGYNKIHEPARQY